MTEPRSHTKRRARNTAPSSSSFPLIIGLFKNLYNWIASEHYLHFFYTVIEYVAIYDCLKGGHIAHDLSEDFEPNTKRKRRLYKTQNANIQPGITIAETDNNYYY
ncbi:hypothetical protein Zmor_000801 [Zophobas morio]|uniref:Uncharacterized protein n=1 Tax=Zophobas morio TaxID=2755281 RepID=A0AA38MNT6_9CUCU|nr:hypothetical protein Zmor_000801 [Zophobas morio]